MRKVLAATAILFGAAGSSEALDEVTFGTNWLAQGEHGGFYQAVADGTYERYGLDVTIRQGGPQAANRALLVAGEIDFYMGGALQALNAVAQGIPTRIVAAMFQKDPQILMAHPGEGIETFEDLASLDTIFMSREGYISYFSWMKAEFEGFSDEQYKPYAFSPTPFILDPRSAQQGYLSSEPFQVARETGWEPVVFLLADHGFAPYSTTIEAQDALIEVDPDLVQRFVDASIEGWRTYLHGDNSAANALIIADNPDMTPELLAHSVAMMNAHGIVESGEALEGGIGCMTAERHRAFYELMVAAGALPGGLDVERSYTLDFVCHGVGLP
jgi:NitT/TauT family transport system substrate-binding protein